MHFSAGILKYTIKGYPRNRLYDNITNSAQPNTVIIKSTTKQIKVQKIGTYKVW